ncbi:hypothetical protein Peur_027617 [Populus x canadensis]
MSFGIALGVFDEDCIFEDPTIKFQGTKLYSRNLNLLVPFFDCPSIGLQDIEKGVNSETYFVLARWKLRWLRTDSEYATLQIRNPIDDYFTNIPEIPMEASHFNRRKHSL